MWVTVPEVMKSLIHVLRSNLKSLSLQIFGSGYNNLGNPVLQRILMS